jgi:predicted deacylase
MRPPATLPLLLALLTVLVVATGLPAAPVAAAATSSSVSVRASDTARAAVLEVRRIGTSVRDRPIRAYRLGDPEARVTAVVLGSMHGDEKAGTRMVKALRTGRPVTGVDLWVIPTINPDGAARGTRGNARGVDLNRNFRHRWAPLTGAYYSGTRAFSEPESRAFKRFVDDVDPRFIASFHQPLHGVGRASEGRAFQRRLSRNLDLPIRAFNCSGACHGTMTAWFNARHRGTAITVELGASPTARYLRGKAARGTVRAVDGSFVR